MSSFGISQTLFSASGSSKKHKKELKLDTSIVCNKRGLSLVSPKTISSTSHSKNTNSKRDSIEKSSNGAKFKFFNCTAPTCNMKTLSLQ